ncbi:MAG: hypothetical protein ACFCUM_15660 [Bacteroidales bacterium]
MSHMKPSYYLSCLMASAKRSQTNRILLLIAICSALNGNCLCQTTRSTDVNFGYGYWDGLQAGVSHRFNRYSAGIDFGWMQGFPHPLWNGRNITFVLNNYYYFRNIDESGWKNLVFLSPMYLNFDGPTDTRNIVFITAGLGSEKSIGSSFAIGYQGGAALPVYNKRIRKTGIDDRWTAIAVPVNLRFRFIYKIGRK